MTAGPMLGEICPVIEDYGDEDGMSALWALMTEPEVSELSLVAWRWTLKRTEHPA